MAGLTIFPLLALASAQPAPADERSYLVSLAGFPLAQGEYVDGFRIDTWGVDILAVCRMPAGWYLRAGRSAAPDGVIEGSASHGVTFLDSDRLHEMNGLALVRIEGPVQAVDIPVESGRIPPTFAGQVTIGSYREGEGREAPITSGNVRLSPAERCPDPQ
jgi:hypothetical protein